MLEKLNPQNLAVMKRYPHEFFLFILLLAVAKLYIDFQSLQTDFRKSALQTIGENTTVIQKNNEAINTNTNLMQRITFYLEQKEKKPSE